MYGTPYVSTILETHEKIWAGHEYSFFWEPEKELKELSDKLLAEYKNCLDLHYSAAHYWTGPATEWIEKAKKKYPQLRTKWDKMEV